MGDDEAAELNKQIACEWSGRRPHPKQTCGVSIADEGHLIRVSKHGPIFDMVAGRMLSGQETATSPTLCNQQATGYELS